MSFLSQVLRCAVCEFVRVFTYVCLTIYAGEDSRGKPVNPLYYYSYVAQSKTFNCAADYATLEFTHAVKYTQHSLLFHIPTATAEFLNDDTDAAVVWVCRALNLSHNPITASLLFLLYELIVSSSIAILCVARCVVRCQSLSDVLVSRSRVRRPLEGLFAQTFTPVNVN